MMNLGNVVADSTIRIPFNSFDAAGASVTLSGFVIGDIKIYKDGDTTERSSTNGYTATTDFDSLTGAHVAVIDLSDNSDADFYEVGSTYDVAIDSVTIDGETVRFWAGRFEIQNAAVGSRLKKVYRGLISIPSGAGTASGGIGATVDPNKCQLAMTGHTSSGSHGTGGAAYLTMNSTQVTATGGTGGGATSITWQVTEWE